MSGSAGIAEDGVGSWREIFFGRFAITTYILNVGMTLFAVNQFVVATLMPTIVADLGGVDFYTWVFSLFGVGAIIGAASAGPLREALGARLAYVGAGLVLALSMVGTALAPDMPTFVAFRLLQGMGGGAVASQAYGLVALLYPPRLRPRVLGTISTTWGLTTVIGPAFGGAFAAQGLWPWAFWSMVPLTLLFVCFAWACVEEKRGHGRLGALPYVRLALLGLAILALSAASLTIPNWARAAVIAASLALAAYTFALDARAERNMFPRQVAAIASPVGALYAIIFLVSIVMAFGYTYTTYLLQVLHGLDPFTAGYLFAIYSFTWTVGALAASNVPEKREPAFIVGGLALVVLAAAGVAATVVSGPVALIALGIAGGGAGIGLMNNPATQRVMALVPESERHVSGTSVQAIRNIGVAFGAAFAGMVAAIAGLADGAPREAIADAMYWVYAVNAAFALLPLAMALAALSGRKQTRS